MILNRFLYLAVVAGFPAAAFADTLSSDGHCYDLNIEARVVEQIPTEMPECSDCIIMSWPWLIDLKIKRVLEGEAQPKLIQAVSVQHTYLRSRYGSWHLRINSAGGFNVVSSATAVRRCAAGTLPAQPYIKPLQGESLESVRAKGEKRYGRHPN